MKNTPKFSVKPLVGAIALTASFMGPVNAQPLVSIGGSFNASALATTSSSIGALNTNHALDIGYSGEASVSLPAMSGDPVQSVIDESQSGSGESEALPGLDTAAVEDALAEMQSGSDESQPAPDLSFAATLEESAKAAISGSANPGSAPQPSEDTGEENSEDTGENSEESTDPQDEIAGNASIVQETLAEVQGSAGGSQQPAGPDLSFAATLEESAKAAVSGSANPGSAPQPSEDTGENSEESTDPQDEIAGNASIVQETVAEVQGSAGGSQQPAPDLSFAATLEESAKAMISGSVGQGDVPQPSEDSSDNSEDEVASAEDAVDEAQDGAGDSEPQQPSEPNPGRPEFAATAESYTRGDAYARF